MQEKNSERNCPPPPQRSVETFTYFPPTQGQDEDEEALLLDSEDEDEDDLDDDGYTATYDDFSVADGVSTWRDTGMSTVSRGGRMRGGGRGGGGGGGGGVGRYRDEFQGGDIGFGDGRVYLEQQWPSSSSGSGTRD